MGNCNCVTVSEKQEHNIPENRFNVVIITNNKSLVLKGMMEVTATDLIFTDNKLAHVWQCPLKYVRKWGCKGNVVSFEVRGKCPSGEGLYAFSTPRASQLFDLVDRNINQGNLQPAGEMSPHVPLPDQSNLAFLNGASSAHDPSLSTAPQSNSPLLKEEFPTYCQVIFDKPPEEYMYPIPVESRIAYTQIDFTKTDTYNKTDSIQYCTVATLPSGTATIVDNTLVSYSKVDFITMKVLSDLSKGLEQMNRELKQRNSEEQ